MFVSLLSMLRRSGLAASATFLAALLALLGCGPSVDASVPHASTACSPADAPFAKVMNPATSDAYESCLVTMEAQFLSADWGVVVGGDVEGQVKWSASVPGSDSEAGGLSTDMKFMFIPKEKSDPVFKLKKGDRVKVTGSTTKTMVGQVIFHATDVTLVPAEPGDSK